MRFIKLKCDGCGAPLDVNENLDKIICNYCGTPILIDDEATELRRIEEVKLKARKDNHEQALKEKNDILEQEIKEKKIKDEINSLERFKKGKFSKILLISFVIAVISVFVAATFFGKFLAIVQAIFFISAWLMGMRFIKEPFKGIRIILAVLGFLLIIPIVNTGGGGSVDSEKIIWEDIYLNEILPQPNGKKGEIIINSDKDLDIYIHKQTEKDYKKYLEECKKKGFVIEAENGATSYEAFNGEGYKLRIDYSDSSKEYNIDLVVPINVKNDAWDYTSLSKKIPVPKSTKGKVESNSSNYYTFYAAEMTLDDFNDYVEELKNKGFDLDHYRNEKSYSAKNKDGYEVNVSYEGFNIIRISVSLY